MEWIWTWSGRCVGYRAGNDLFLSDGWHAGRFFGDAVYAPDGAYLGELITGRLVTHPMKRGWREAPFGVSARREPRQRRGDYLAEILPAGYDDFRPLALVL